MNNLPIVTIEAVRAATPRPLTPAQEARMAYAALPPLTPRLSLGQRFGVWFVRLGLTLDPDAAARLQLHPNTTVEARS